MAVLTAAAGILVLALLAVVHRAPDLLARADTAFQPSVRIEDRQGRLLREFLSGRETRSRWTPLSEISPHLIHAALAAEDRRFYHHPGVDPVAVLRAAWWNLRTGRVQSGASTITMQLARLLDPGPRTFRRKVREAFIALKLETLYSKDRILEEYLNRVPCGNLASGATAAAHLYFNKTPGNLSPAEAAFLMALPRAPSTYNPFRRPDLVLARRNLILGRMARQGYLTEEEAARARVETADLNRTAPAFQAPHFTERVRRLLPEPPPARVRTTLDLELQSGIERLTAQAVARGRDQGITQAAVVVLDH
ncbi:MAG: transglycosylase domain-containing protein, partial [Thermodesulfobacteriota bacterium]